MSEHSRALATIFEAMADGLDIQGANYHRVLAYRRAAENLVALAEPLEQLWHEERLEDIPGIGATLASKIDEYLRTGTVLAYERLLDELPMGLLDVIKIPGVGPRRTQLFWEELCVTSVEELEAVASAGQLQQLKGIGPRTEQNILDGIRAWRRQRTGRIPLGVAWPLIQEIAAALRELPSVLRIEPAGSLRRQRATVGDLDLLAASQDAEPVMARFRDLPMVAEVLLTGPTKTSIRTMDGIQVDLRVLDPERWGSALQYFTGSQAHNIRLRALARQRGLSLSEYGFRREKGDEIVCADEPEVYATLDLPWIPPELREDRGEIEAALEGRLPHLIERADLKGDFQFHTTFSDGDHDLEAMARAARDAGLHYVVVADHAISSDAATSNGWTGVSPEALDDYLAEVARVNALFGGAVRVVAGIEVSILADGALNWPDEALARLEFVIASVHSDYGQPQEQTTARLLEAIRNPHVAMIGHPTGRLIGKRAEMALNMEAVFQAALEHQVAIEINAWPQRLDLKDVYVRRAVALGVPLAISSNAHDRESFAVLDFGVAMARRGGAEAGHVLNTRSVDEVLAWRGGKA